MYMNPIRYKSYYYDIESNMYYLNSRYYHPLLCRFITPDSYEYIDINNIKTFNLYAYCNNDPINYADPEGKFIFGLIAGIFGLVAPVVTATPLLAVPIVAVVGAIAYTKSIVHRNPEYESHYSINDLVINDETLDEDTKSININISENTITIYDSYLINDERDMTRIIELIMGTDEYKKYGFYRSKESYIKEWKAHKFN